MDISQFTGLDFFVFLILAVNTILGMSRGASKEIISMMCLSAALIFCIKFTVPLTNFFNRSPLINDVVTSKIIQNFMIAVAAGPVTADLLQQIMYSISLLVCFVGVFSVCEAGLSVSGFTEVFSFPYATLSRKVGASLGFVRGYIISLMFLSIITLHLYGGNSGLPGSSLTGGSFFINIFQSQIQTFDSLVGTQQVGNYNQLYQNQPINEGIIYKNLTTPSQSQQFQPGATPRQPSGTSQTQPAPVSQ